MGRPEYWTEDRIREAARGYRFISDFSKDYDGAYAAIKNRYRHLKNELFPEFKKLIWSAEKIREEALKYSTRMEFKMNAQGAYSRACHLGITDEICSHMVNTRIKNGRFDLGEYENISGLYFLYSGDELVYIGKSFSCVVSRIRDHYSDKLFDHLEIYNVSNKSDIMLSEMYLIMKNKPRYNKDAVYDDDTTIHVNGIDRVLGNPIIVGASFGVNAANTIKQDK